MRKTITLTQAIRILAQDRHEPCLCQLREGPDNDLHITFSRGAAVSDPEPDQWELVFEDYILYQVRNESFYSFRAEEIRTGKYLAMYERSRLLEYLPTPWMQDCWSIRSRGSTTEFLRRTRSLTSLRRQTQS